MKKLIIILLVFCWITGRSQQFSIKRVELSADKVFAYYDLIDTLASHSYTINLFYSRDNFISPLQKVRGDVGLEVRPGANRKIEWSAKDELGPDFKRGNVQLEVKGRLYIPFIRFDGQYHEFKRGKKYELTWTGGTQQNILNFDLYQKGKKVTTFANIANVGHYTLVIPNSVKPGKDFTFRISDTKNKDQVVNSQPFSIERRIPLVYKIAVPALMGAGAYIVIKALQPKPMEGPPGFDELQE